MMEWFTVLALASVVLGRNPASDNILDILQACHYMTLAVLNLKYSKIMLIKRSMLLSMKKCEYCNLILNR